MTRMPAQGFWPLQSISKRISTNSLQTGTGSWFDLIDIHMPTYLPTCRSWRHSLDSRGSPAWLRIPPHMSRHPEMQYSSVFMLLTYCWIHWNLSNLQSWRYFHFRPIRLPVTNPTPLTLSRLSAVNFHTSARLANGWRIDWTTAVQIFF